METVPSKRKAARLAAPQRCLRTGQERASGATCLEGLVKAMTAWIPASELVMPLRRV